MVEIKLGEKSVAHSRNLRGILSYARKAFVRNVYCTRNGDGTGFVCFTFDDGARCRTEFADYTVLLRWVRSRRSWDLREIFCSENMTQFTILCGDARY